VDAVGLVQRSLPFTTSNTIVRTFRQALSLDERRAKYKANLWNRPPKLREERLCDTPAPMSPWERSVSPMPMPMPEPEPDPDDDDMDPDKKHKRWPTEKEEKILGLYEQLYAEREERPTDVEEVWFAVGPQIYSV
jgi:uncharacterized protein (DUF2235 family)